MAGFLGLHVDIDKVFVDNMKKQGLRKYGTVLINEGDKLTPDKKEELKILNRQRYGLSDEYLKYLYLPKSSNVKVYEIEKILNARKKLSTGEKIERLMDIRRALEKKLNVLSKGKRIRDFDYLKPREFEERFGNSIRAEKQKAEMINGRSEE